VAGSTTGPATNVTVNGGLAELYNDNTFARDGHSLVDGTNTFTAIALDAYGRRDTNTISVWLPASISHLYDSNGDLLSDGRRGFAYDDENQLITVTVTNEWKSIFRYDGKMRRRERIECVWQSGAWVTNEIVRYVYDGNLVLQERWFAPQLSSTIPQKTVSYTRGKDLSGTLEGAGGIGGLLGRTDSQSSIASGGGGSTCFYHCDAVGNVTTLLDGAQQIAARYLYDPFGNILSQTGPLAEENLYRFSSKEFHPQSGLVYYLYRYYEASLQRWLNRDPLATAISRAFPIPLENYALPFEFLAGGSLYGFAYNDSLSEVDAYGYDVWVLTDSCSLLGLHEVVVGSNPDGTFWFADMNAGKGGLSFFGLFGLNCPANISFYRVGNVDPNSTTDCYSVSVHIVTSDAVSARVAREAQRRMENERSTRYDLCGNNCWDFASELKWFTRGAKMREIFY
jgi:RHS repeat-associated protein